MVILKGDRRKLRREAHKARTLEKNSYCQVRRVLGGKLGLDRCSKYGSGALDSTPVLL